MLQVGATGLEEEEECKGKSVVVLNELSTMP
jgi:hypothetical protein